MSQGALDVDGRRALAARLAAVLFLGLGILAFVSLPTVAPGVARAITVAIGIIALAIGITTSVAPWGRWPAHASFALAPIALLLVCVGNAVGSHEPFDYAVFFVIVHAWLGVAQPRRASLFLAPLTALAYVIPLSELAADPPHAMASALVVVPACVLLGEGIAWLMAQLDSSEHVRRSLADALDRERETRERLVSANEQLQYLAFHDPVTGVANRAAFNDHLDVALARARRAGESLMICSLDLDKFKLVNDTLGHAAGDDLLREVTARLTGVIRDGDVVARTGGDEFLLLMPPGADGLPDPEAIAARIRGALEPPVRLGDMDVYVSASIGMAQFPRDGVEVHGLLRIADAAMYRGKRDRGSVGVIDTLRTIGTNELELSSRLRASARSESWTLRYQPIVELVLGRTVGAEALVRWSDPEHGLRAPSEFLALAEELDLGPALTRWVLEEIAGVGRQWGETGVLDDLTMLTVNLTPRELWHPTLTDRLGRLADELGRPELLVVEVTEAALAMDTPRTAAILSSLRDHGIRVALDDFGSGYSSLSRLRSLPIDIVKIDRSFIDGIDRERAARGVMRSIVRLAAGLDMVAIAEGIETERQLEIAVAEGCTLAQGFLFGPPVCAERFGFEMSTSGGVLAV